MRRRVVRAVVAAAVAAAAVAAEHGGRAQSSGAQPPPGASPRPAAQAPAPAQAASPAAAGKLVDEGRAAYRKADYGVALIKFEEAVRQGASGGELFYQMGFCYKAVRDDAASSRSYMARAVPLLEQQIKDPARRSLESYYYLAAILLNEIPDADRMASTAREAVNALEGGHLPRPTTGEGLFQAGRLYGFTGQRDKAVAHYERAIAALEKEGGKQAGILRHCLEASADAASENKEWDKAAGFYRQLQGLEPSRDEVRMPLALALFNAGKELEAVPVWAGSRDPRLETQKVYLERVARHYVELGRPKAEAPADDQELRKAIVEAGKAFGELVLKDEARAREASEAWRKEMDERRKARRKSKSGPPPRPDIEELQSIPVEKMTAEQRLRAMGYGNIELEPAPPPPSAERLAAEKRFFALLAELVRRGHLVQDFAATNGLAPLIFK